MSEKSEEQALEEALEETTPAPKKAKKKTAKKAAKKKPSPASETLPDPDELIHDPNKAAEDPEGTKRAPIETESQTAAAAEKREADAARRDQAIKDAPRPPDPSAEDKAEQERKAKLREQMAEIQDEIDDLEAAVDTKKEELKGVSAELYPHLVESDHHVDAVRGYIASQKELRKTRAASPARIKAILEAAGKSPVDQAFAAQRARGAKRPVRPAAGVTPAADAAKE